MSLFHGLLVPCSRTHLHGGRMWWGEMFPNKQEAELKKGSARDSIVPSSNLQSPAFSHQDPFSKIPPSPQWCLHLRHEPGEGDISYSIHRNVSGILEAAACKTQDSCFNPIKISLLRCSYLSIKCLMAMTHVTFLTIISPHRKGKIEIEQSFLVICQCNCITPYVVWLNVIKTKLEFIRMIFIFLTICFISKYRLRSVREIGGREMKWVSKGTEEITHEF